MLPSIADCLELIDDAHRDHQLFLVIADAAPASPASPWTARAEGHIFTVAATVAARIRDDEVAARVVGVNVVRGRVSAFAVGCTPVGLAGSVRVR